MAIERKEIRPGKTFSPAALAIHNARYQLAKPFVRGKAVLDIACGEGLGAAQLATSWAAGRVVGVDNSTVAVDSAKTNFGHIANLAFEVADAFAFLESQTETFDVITCIETLEHLENSELLLRLLRQNLKPDGVLVITAPNDAYYFGPGPTFNEHHKSPLSFEAFRTLIGSEFDNAQLFAGVKLQGFAAVPVAISGIENRFESDPETTGTHLDFHAVATGAASPNTLDPATGTVFYAAVCGPEGSSAKASIGMLAAQSQYHPPAPGLWHRLPEQKRGSSVLLLTENEGDHSEIEARVNEFLAGRLTLRISSPLNSRPAQSGATSHVHFNSLSILKELLDSNEEGRPWLHEIARHDSAQTWSAARGKGEHSSLARAIEYQCDPIDLAAAGTPEGVSALARQLLTIVVLASSRGSPQLSELRLALLDPATGRRQQSTEARRLAHENAALLAQLADARLLAEEYQRRAVSAEDSVAACRKELSKAESKLAKATANLKQIKTSPAFRFCQRIIEAYRQPLTKGLRLPRSILALQRDNRRRRVAGESQGSGEGNAE